MKYYIQVELSESSEKHFQSDHNCGCMLTPMSHPSEKNKETLVLKLCSHVPSFVLDVEESVKDLHSGKIYYSK